jgi:hypothetical protein
MAAYEGRVVVFETGAYYYRDETGREWRKEELTNWLDDIPDNKFNVRYFGGKTAFIFEDPFYTKLLIIHFGIQFEWEEDAIPNLYGPTSG